MQSLANRYLELGGTKIFGKIESFNTKRSAINPQREDFTEVNIREMESVPDDSAAGFHVKETGRTVTYPLDIPQMAPLTGPDFKRYGTFDYFAVNGVTFYTDCPRWQEGYFDFIVTSEGAVKAILERYVSKAARIGS